MRTTLSLEPDVAAEVERLRREEGLGLSAAVNRLARSGMSTGLPSERPAFRQFTAPLGVKVSLDNIGDVLELLDET